MYITVMATEWDSHTKIEPSNKEESDVIYMQDMLKPHVKKKRKFRNV